jgi:diguanylate cyclase (GGDEF)-like protein
MDVNNTGERKRLHFGILFGAIENANQYEIWRGIYEYAHAHDIHLTAYIGTYRNADGNFSSNLDTCFETILHSKSLDGLILLSGFIAQNVGVENFNGHTNRIPKTLPVVSVSIPMPGIPSVLADGVSGIFDTVQHLITTHGKKNIAFVKGPDGHPEAEERLAGYKKALTANGIAIDERYIFPGDFTQGSGRNAAAELLDIRKLPADAIVTSNDQEAIGVLLELRNRNILVPAEIAVTGFDDDKSSASNIPSLSTARQDFFEIGMVSAGTLTKIINGEPAEDSNHVPPVYVARQSCGCLEGGFLGAAADGDAPGGAGSLLAYVVGRFTPLFQQHVPQHETEGLAAALVEKIKEKPFRKDAFLHLFDETLVKYNHLYKNFTKWDDALIILAAGVSLYNGETGPAHSILPVLVSATTLVSDVQSKDAKNEESIDDGIRDHLQRMTRALILTFDIDSVVDRLYKSLPDLYIHTVLIGLYRSPIKIGDPKANRTIETLIGFDGGQKFNMHHNSWNPILFSDYATFDKFDFERERRTLFFIPLFFEDEEVGIILLPYQTHIPLDAYDMLRVSISAAVKGSELLSTIQTLSITDDLTGLLNRRGFFQFVYSRLHHLNRHTWVIPFVMFMDMDGLKLINDTYGHKEGDIAISAFAKVLKDALREEDIIGRMGGDEFVVFSSVKRKEGGEQVVKRIRRKLDEYNSQRLHPYQVAGSIGSVTLDDATIECFEASMLRADSVLYEEKMEKKKKGLSRQ